MLESAPGAEQRDEITPCPRDGAHPFLGRPRAIVENVAVWLDHIAKRSVGEIGSRDPGRMLPRLVWTGSARKLKPAGFRVRRAQRLDKLDVLKKLLRDAQRVRFPLCHCSLMSSGTHAAGCCAGVGCAGRMPAWSASDLEPG